MPPPPQRPRAFLAAKDFAAIRQAMLDLARERLPAWTDQSPNDPGVMLVELFAAMGDALFYDQDRIAGESYLDTARERRSVMQLLRLIGYELRPPTPAAADLTLLFAPDATGTFTVPSGAEFSTTRDATGTPIGFRYLRPAVTLDLGALPALTFQGAAFKAFRTLPVVQVDAVVSGEIIGSSDGTGGQSFALARAPLLVGELRVQVDDGAGPVLWTRRDSLLASAFDDEHFAVRFDENGVAWIAFGDGTYGKVPRRGRNNLTASYAVGGGAKGNVPRFAISKIVTPLDPLRRITNDAPATGGDDAEDIALAAARAPRQYRSMGRAVTAADYEAHAMSFGVHKARAIARTWNRVSLYVAPAGGGYPSDTLKEDLRAYFQAKRVLTTDVVIEDPAYVGVVIEGSLIVDPGYFRAEIVQAVNGAVLALWSFDNVSFEDTLYISKIYEAIEAVAGVTAINVTRFARSDAPPGSPALAPDGTLRFGFAEIPHTPGITLTSVTGGRADG